MDFLRLFLTVTTVFLTASTKLLTKRSNKLEKKDFNIGFQLIINAIIILLTFLVIDIEFKPENVNIIKNCGITMALLLITTLALIAFIRFKCWEEIKEEIQVIDDGQIKKMLVKDMAIDMKGIIIPIITGVISLIWVIHFLN